MSARSENIHITCKLTPAEIEAIDAEAAARGVSISQVVDEAVSALLRDPGIYQTGLPLPPRAAGAPAIQRGYRLPPATVGLMDTAKRSTALSTATSFGRLSRPWSGDAAGRRLLLRPPPRASPPPSRLVRGRGLGPVGAAAAAAANPSPSLPLGLYAYAHGLPAARGDDRHVGAPARLHPPRRPRPQARGRRGGRHLLLGPGAGDAEAQRDADARAPAGRGRRRPGAVEGLPAARSRARSSATATAPAAGTPGSSASSPSRTWPASTSTSGEGRGRRSESDFRPLISGF